MRGVNPAYGELAAEAHLGTQIKVIRYLLSVVPPTHRDFDTLKSEVFFWSVEAASLFDPSLGNKFVTFLTCHLRLRSRNFVRDCWSQVRRIRTPTGGNNDDNLRVILCIADDTTEEARWNEFLDELSPESRFILLLLVQNLTEISQLVKQRVRANRKIARYLGVAIPSFLQALAEIQAAYSRSCR